jgi:hypothetical protein
MLLSPSLFAFAAILDGRSGVESDGLAARISSGTAPVFLAEPKDPKNANYNITVNFTAVVQDADNDVLRVTWDWGDGSVNVTTTTSPTYPLCTLRLGHVYAPDPEQGRGWYGYPYSLFFNMKIYLDDGNDNNVSCNTLVNVSMPFINGLPVRPSLHINGTSSTVLDPEDTVYVVANSSDPEGESLTWTYFFEDDLGEVYRTVVMNTPATAPGERVWVNVSHSFGTIGQHKIDVFVSDALVPYQTYPHNATNTIFVNVDVNHKPGAATINVNPDTPIVNVTRGYVLVNYSIEAYDQDGDPLTITWDFDDGLPVVVNESASGVSTKVPTMYKQTRNYSDAGSFNVTVVVSDGRPDHQLYKYRVVNVSSTNLPPVLRAFQPVNMSGGSWALPNETIQFQIIISDPEMNEVEVTINWGDGSEISHFILSDFVGKNVTIMVNHTYTTIGNFTIVLNYTDNKVGSLNHSKTYTLTVQTKIVYIAPPEEWSWWDYTTLGLVCLVPVGLVIWMHRVSQHRRMLDKEGLTSDEWRLLQDKSVVEVIEQEKNR